MKRVFLSVLLLLLVCGVSWAKENIVLDGGHLNMWSVSFMYDHRWVEANVPYFSKASGDYFLLNAQITTGGELVSFNKIMGVKATHSPTGYEYNLRLLQNCVFWPGFPPGTGELRVYSEFIRPEDWMYEGIWTIELKYKDALREKHVQYQEISMIKPYALTTLQQPRAEITLDGKILVSWLAQGLPPYPNPGKMVFNYRVFIYDMRPENMDCPGHQINLGGQGGWFDPATWRVNFLIPAKYAGKPIRMETRALVYGPSTWIGPSGWIAHRAAYMTVLP